MPFEDEQGVYYTVPAQLLRTAAQGWSKLTAYQRIVSADVRFGRYLSADRQHTDNHKWSHYVQIDFSREIPSISWRRMGFFNQFLLLTEGCRVLIGRNFVTILTDNPHLDPDQLTQAFCNALDWKAESYKQYPRHMR